MPLFLTPTPTYKDQPNNGTTRRQGGVYGWLSSLLRTPTPAYKTKPAPSAKAQTDQTDEPTR